MKLPDYQHLHMNFSRDVLVSIFILLALILTLSLDTFLLVSQDRENFFLFQIPTHGWTKSGENINTLFVSFHIKNCISIKTFIYVAHKYNSGNSIPLLKVHTFCNIVIFHSRIINRIYMRFVAYLWWNFVSCLTFSLGLFLLFCRQSSILLKQQHFLLCRLLTFFIPLSSHWSSQGLFCIIATLCMELHECSCVKIFRVLQSA